MAGVGAGPMASLGPFARTLARNNSLPTPTRRVHSFRNGEAGPWEPVAQGEGGRFAVIRYGRTSDGVPVAEYSRAPGGHIRTFGRESIAAAVCRLLNSGQGF